MQSCVLDFDLTDEGTIRFKQFGEQTGPEILARGYPLLKKALEGEAFAEHAIEQQAEPQQYDSAASKILRKAVQAERKRLASCRRTSATTERGKEIQRELGGSGAYVDAIVEHVASKVCADISLGRKQSPIEQLTSATTPTSATRRSQLRPGPARIGKAKATTSGKP